MFCLFFDLKQFIFSKYPAEIKFCNRIFTPQKLLEYKNKDLIGISWQLAFSLRNSGCYFRQDIIWHKP